MSPEQQKILQKIISEIGYYLGEKAKVDFDNSSDPSITQVNITVSDPSLLLSDGGGNLIAWQHLCRILFRKRTETAVNFVLDINNYRQDRQKYLASLAFDMAQKVAEEKRLVILKPMNSYERRLIHLTLAEDKRVSTESLGEAEERRVIIKPQNK